MQQLICPNCGNTEWHIENIVKEKRRGCFMWCVWLLLGVLTCGLILIIPMFTNRKRKNKTKFVCKNCGFVLIK